MNSPGVQIQLDPVSPPEASKSRDAAPAKKRDDQGETKEAAAAAAALTVSFAEILRSKRHDIKTGAEGREKTDPLLKAPGQKEGEEALLQANGQLAAGRKRLRQSAIEVQAKETLDHAKELAGAAMKAATGKGPNGDNQEAGQSAELTKKGALTPAEENLLKEMIQKNGNLAAQKKAAQMMGFVNGEPLTRREGIGAVKSMTAKEGEILKNLSGGEEAEGPKKFKAGKSARTQQPFVMRDTPDGTEKAAPAVSSADAMKQEFAGLAEGQQDKLAAAGSTKKQGATGGTNPEMRDVSCRRRNDFRSSGQGHRHRCACEAPGRDEPGPRRGSPDPSRRLRQGDHDPAASPARHAGSRCRRAGQPGEDGHAGRQPGGQTDAPGRHGRSPQRPAGQGVPDRPPGGPRPEPAR